MKSKNAIFVHVSIKMNSVTEEGSQRTGIVVEFLNNLYLQLNLDLTIFNLTVFLQLTSGDSIMI